MDTILKVLVLAVFWAAHLLENYLSLKVVKTAYIRALPKWMRWFTVAPVWSWINKLVSGAAMTFTALTAPGGVFLTIIIGVFAVSKLLNVYRGILVYTREHNLAYVQERKKTQGTPLTARDKIKDLAVRITPRRK